MRHVLFIILFFGTLISCKNDHKRKEKDGMVFIHGDTDIKDFWIDKYPVTVAQFAQFVKITGYITQAEEFGDGGLLDFKTGVWGLKKGANWHYPLGKDSLAAPTNHPVTQVSWYDAMAYCKWAKKRLPTSEEYIFSEKNGYKNFANTYSWGDEIIENGKYEANFWQGLFPFNNTLEDGFLTTSPVGYFGLNEAGLGDIGGNVWQWCSDENAKKPGEYYQRGGSYLCDPKDCHGFKIGGFSSSSKETSLMHVGFRCVRD